MNRFTIAFVCSAFAAPAFASAAECSAPPVRSSAQALCYATAYAEKNGLAHGPALRKRTARGTSAWTVSFRDTRRNAQSSGWQVDVDMASGTVTRFTSYKKPKR